MKILVTGCAGFIGYHLCMHLLNKKQYEVHGLDNINNYYDHNLKKDRLLNLKKSSRKFYFHKINIKNKNQLIKCFVKNKYKYVVHLAAQPGVRYSIKNPRQYLNTNIIGFFNILEACKMFNIKHLVFASTSSVYGNGSFFPSKENDNTDKPLSFYAATKKSNEVMAYSYSNLYKLPCTGLRFFTVYGPHGRPDMSLFKFTKSILKSKTIYLYNKGFHIRDFTYIDDAIKVIIKVLTSPPKQFVPFDILNVGSGNPQKLKFFLSIIESFLKKKAKVILKGPQPGDVLRTHAYNKKLVKKTKIKFKTSFVSGVGKFINWYKSYYKS